MAGVVKRACSLITTSSQKLIKSAMLPSATEDSLSNNKSAITKQSKNRSKITESTIEQKWQPLNSIVSEYVYEPLLGPTSFRLLRIGVNADGPDSIHLEIDKYDRADVSCPGYMALSYVWGDVANRLPVRMNNHQMYVTSNLREALLHLMAVKPGCTHWWIDALCMNQQDEVEKGHQVNQMRDIYRDAEQVIAWLGPGRGDVAMLLELMDRPLMVNNPWENYQESSEATGVRMEAGYQLGPCSVFMMANHAMVEDWNSRKGQSMADLEISERVRVAIEKISATCVEAYKDPPRIYQHHAECTSKNAMFAISDATHGRTQGPDLEEIFISLSQQRAALAEHDLPQNLSSLG